MFVSKDRSFWVVLGFFCLASLGILLSVHQNVKKNTAILREVRGTVSEGEHSVETLLRVAYQEFNVPRHGLIHIGAHNAQELPIYKKFGIQNILWIEADSTHQNVILKNIQKHPGSKLALFAASDVNGKATFHVTSNGGQSSSLLELKEHLRAHPNVRETGTKTVDQRRLDDFLEENPLAHLTNVMVLDIQGAELMALKGSVETLKNIDAIVTEVSCTELYKGCALIEDLDAFLLKHGFRRINTLVNGFSWGDALYLKKTFLSQTHQRRPQ